MGKKRGKDKSSREDDDIDLAGKEYFIIFMSHDNLWKVLGDFLTLCFIYFHLFTFIGPSCRHIKKGTDQTLLKKLSGNCDWTSCQDCKHEGNKENMGTAGPQDPEEEQETAAAWMCLKCGHRVSLFKSFIIQILTVYEMSFC